MRAHLQETPIVLSVLADEHRIDSRFHIVINPARAGALEEREGALVRVEHHLLALARIGANEHHPAMAEPHMRDLQGGRHAVDQRDLVGPVELVGLARRKAQRDIGVSRRACALLPPGDRIPPDRRVAASVAKSAGSSKIRISVRRSRGARPSFLSSRASSCSRHGPIRGNGCCERS